MSVSGALLQRDFFFFPPLGARRHRVAHLLECWVPVQYMLMRGSRGCWCTRVLVQLLEPNWITRTAQLSSLANLREMRLDFSLTSIFSFLPFFRIQYRSTPYLATNTPTTVFEFFMPPVEAVFHNSLLKLVPALVLGIREIYGEIFVCIKAPIQNGTSSPGREFM